MRIELLQGQVYVSQRVCTRSNTHFLVYLEDIDYYHPKDLLYALKFVVCLAIFAMLLELQWSRANAVFVAQLVRTSRSASCTQAKQSTPCYVQSQKTQCSYRDSSVYACAQLMLVDNLICRAPSPSASAVFGTDFGVLLQQLISRDVPDWMKQSQATQVRLCCGTLLCEELTLQVLSSISGNDIGLC
jgi:hypothetical protein